MRPCLTRLSAVTPEAPSFLDTDRAFVTSCPEQEVSGTRYYRHNRHPSPDGLARMMVLQNRFIMGGRLDHFSNWRLDIDHMTYELMKNPSEILALTGPPGSDV
ncbi:E3 UBIQUITIN-PROTEIN LIGASE RNF165 [Salix koriyanagi]|uniref:E3 UBIQUITIN-PROTEIN LIGASE RNF165 n=1 Tax=Salix koriyanagi TaxID=2511006 RepID=A0A9Q0PGN2_9ROSI|nr:E3 UBIQUITIN-PROTEIN LIGASE RNF165 [Salix koriyanagi]